MFVPPSPSSRSPGIEFNHSAASVCCWVCGSQPDVWGVPPPTSTRFLESCGASQTKSKMWDVTGTFNYRSFHVMQSQYKLLPVSPPSTPPVPFVLFIHLTPSLLFSLPIWLVPCSIWSLAPLVLLTPLLLLSLTSFPPSCQSAPFLPDNTQEDLSLPWAVDSEAPSSRQCPKNQRVSRWHWLLLCPKTRRKKTSGLSFKYCPMQVRELDHHLWGHCEVIVRSLWGHCTLLWFVHYIVRYKTSQELVTHDSHNNTYTYKYTFSVEIVPVCKVNFQCVGFS